MGEESKKRKREASRLRSQRYRERSRQNVAAISTSILNIPYSIHTLPSEGRNSNYNNNQVLEHETATMGIIISDINYFENNENIEGHLERDELALDDELEHGYDEQWFDVLNTDEEDDEVDSDNDVEQLQKWAATSQIPQKKIDQLLAILRQRAFPQLPRSAKTFLKTLSAVYNIKKLPDNSEFVYFGIKSHLKRIVQECLHRDLNLQLIFNVDGIPLFKSSSKQFWPILCQLYHPSVSLKPFAVAIYCGNSKPHDLNQYLGEFINEIRKLQVDGIEINGKVFQVSVKAFICDRPARAFIKCIKGHVGYYACERCEVKGVRIERRIVYPEMNCTLRDHQSFCNQVNIEHHTGISPLVGLNHVDMIKMFILDFMHLVCLGTMKKMLCEFWLDKKSPQKLSYNHKMLLSQQLISIRSQIPCKFQRTTRDINDIQKWKATEYRFFLLHAGPVLLKSCLKDELYKHFTLLSVACRILSSNLAIDFNAHAKFFLRQFVIIAQKIYGAKSIVSNMHSLIHLADDAKYLNMPISKFTAFPFESLLGQIKKLLRHGNRPLAQVCRRLHEANLIDTNFKVPSSIEVIDKNNPDANGKIVIKKLRYKDAILTFKEPNNTVLLHNDSIMQLKELYTTIHNDTINVVGSVLKKIKPLLTFPCNSEILQMWRVSKTTENDVTCSLKTVKNKMVLLVLDDDTEHEKIYAISLLHM